MTPRTIIDDLGGVCAVAGHLALPVSTVSNWKTRGSIPSRYLPPLRTLARQQGIPDAADRLIDAHEGAP